MAVTLETTYAAPSTSAPSLLDYLDKQVRDTIQNAKTIPSFKEEAFVAIKPGLLQLWDELKSKDHLERKGKDQEYRSYFVALQCLIEHVLSVGFEKKEIKSCAGMIHTPMPATPLCTQVDADPKGITHPSMHEDPARLYTVSSRAQIVRQFLANQADLYVVYPKEGLQKRKESEQKIYQEACKSYKNHLHDRPLDCQAIENDLVGAFYVFDKWGFTIQFTQANSPQEDGHYVLNLGAITSQHVHERIDRVMHMVREHSSSELAWPF
jgi:hypothetical protein